MRYALALLMALSFTTPSHLGGQATGQQVRISSSRYLLRDETARVLSATADSLTVELRGGHRDTLALYRAAIDRLEVSTPGDRHTVRGTFIGLAIGAATGFAIGVSQRRQCPDGSISLVCVAEPLASAERGLIDAGVSGAIGAGVGTLIGALWRTNRWERIDVRPLAQRRVGLELSISF